MFLHKEKAKPPRSLRSARLSVVKNQISTPIAQTTIASPKKVIKSLYDYHAQNPYELSFTRGDFFLVTGRENDPNYYEAFNPITNSRGIVPVHYFQVLEKHERTMATTSTPRRKDQNEGQKKLQPLYGIVLYDFQAERPDELDAKAGEAIIIIAQSNTEWFVAKPIGRLGGPGLIPVSFVDIRDATTGRTVTTDILQKTTTTTTTATTTTTLHPSPLFPNIQEWKKQTQGYEASSISLGRFERPMEDMAMSDHSIIDDYFSLKEEEIRDQSIVISAYVDSYILEGNQYWFIVFGKLANGKYRVLYRLYEDFYDFQINFLQEFPSEAGKLDKPRILPYMPGPLNTVDNEITAERARDLSKYCEDLLKLPKYLSESTWVQSQLFGIHEGDIETDIDPGIGRSIISGYYGVTSNDNSNNNNMTTTTARNNHNLSSPTTTTTPIPITTTTTVKVKIIYKDEIFAIKVPIPNTVEFLKTKIFDRLGFDAQLQYKSGDYLTELNAEAFEEAARLDDLLPTQTTGYKPGEKKSLQEYQKLDAQDESLNKWKESLGLNKAAIQSGPVDDPRRVVVEYIALEVEGRPDVRVDLSTPFQHDVVSGLKYLQVVKRKGVRVDKTEEMIGSYGPSAEPYEKKFQMEEAPSGFFVRDHYEAKSKFVDDDGVTHMEWTWSFDIKKDW
ncbi:uncharacterized protein BX663DRAFT_532872 [Cokeromyces recurvatus]|uniref:uncharacterized protein n=1 Tax=Cokeromyces recurvatus TaxID=90255 RepID=UPI00221F3195|nr:uncharacterized protein BX663DRAFT_532872 [Cokeromyces recurvatus]KAI7899382.1 hypothetical protein BX663DRAFT_532872 [Cokeromyces recurvatus]